MFDVPGMYANDKERAKAREHALEFYDIVPCHVIPPCRVLTHRAELAPHYCCMYGSSTSELHILIVLHLVLSVCAWGTIRRCLR